MERVVVTGLGMLTPLGCGVASSWRCLIEGKSGIGKITRFDASDHLSKVAGEIPRADGQTVTGEDDVLVMDDHLSPREQRRVDGFIAYAMIAARQALQDSGWDGVLQKNEVAQKRTGVLIGSGIGGLETIARNALILDKQGTKRISPLFIPSCLINLASGNVAIEHNIRGPNHSVVTACSTGAHAIGDATQLIRLGKADVMVAGGAENAICPLGFVGFDALRALSSRFNDTPTQASRPWDEQRDGFVMGEGAGILVLESLDHAQRRGAPIYGEVVGYGMSGDAHHVTAPLEDGGGAHDAMRAALDDAELNADDIDYINAHGTSTPLGDEAEIHAVKQLFGNHVSQLSMSSTKSAIGHLLGAAGSVEAIFSLLAMRDQTIPPTLNLDAPSACCDGINLVPHESQTRACRFVLSNSFGFGGTNASLIFAHAP